jgi:hypothetical protein
MAALSFLLFPMQDSRAVTGPVSLHDGLKSIFFMHPFRYSRLLSIVCFTQGSYYMLTGIWPLVHIRSFIWVTGPKSEIWLVKTVGILVLVIGAVLIKSAAARRISPEIMLLAAGCAIGLALVDTYYAFINRIWNVYLLDALAEVILLAGWCIAWYAAGRK